MFCKLCLSLVTHYSFCWQTYRRPTKNSKEYTLFQIDELRLHARPIKDEPDDWWLPAWNLIYSPAKQIQDQEQIPPIHGLLRDHSG